LPGIAGTIRSQSCQESLIFSGRAGGPAVAAKELQALTQPLKRMIETRTFPLPWRPDAPHPGRDHAPASAADRLMSGENFPHCYAARGSGGGTAGSAVVNAPSGNGPSQDFCVLTECGGFLRFFRIDTLAMADQM
jgi:hypothetical protein